MLQLTTVNITGGAPKVDKNFTLVGYKRLPSKITSESLPPPCLSDCLELEPPLVNILK